MKKIGIILLCLLSLVMISCGDEKKETAKEASGNSKATLNPAGYTFYDVSDIRIHFNLDGTVVAKTQNACFAIFNKDTLMSWPRPGKYRIEKNKIIMECGDLVWEGFLENNELKLKCKTDLSTIQKSMLCVGLRDMVMERSDVTKIKEMLPAEKYSDFESSLLLLLSQESYIDNIADAYGKIYHNDEYEKVRNDEFEWRDKSKEYIEEFKTKLDSIDDEYAMRFYWNLGDYDFDNACFNLDFTSSRDSRVAETISTKYVFSDIKDRTDLNLDYIESELDYINHSVDINYYSGSWGGYPLFETIKFPLKMDNDTAKEFLARRKSEDGKTDKKVLCVVYYTVGKELPTKNSNGKTKPGDFIHSASVTGTLTKLELFDTYNNNELLYSGKLKTQ